MKKIISQSLPILFLVTALAFMMTFHHDDTLSDKEAAEFETLSKINHTIDLRTENDEEFKSISEGETVSIVDADDDVILEISQEEWENREDYYSQKYNLN